MEVDKNNFFEILPRIEQSIAECDFLALDLEMTGLTSGKMERQKAWDSAQQRYLKVRDGASAVCPTQFGLCTFKYSASTNTYVTWENSIAKFFHFTCTFLPFYY
jgi:poly(A)-specific ribonuclease